MAALLLVAFKQPELLIEGRFWAEDGIDYFARALNEGWPSLIQPEFGYYSLYNRLAALAASAFPLESAPLVMTYAALPVMLLPSAILLFCPLRVEITPWRRCLAGLLMVLPSVSYEVWLNVINLQFWFALSVALFLLVDFSRTWTLRLLAPLAVLASLTGPVVAFMTPLFLLRAVFLKERGFRIATALLLPGAVLQVFLMVMSLQGESDRQLMADPAALIPTLHFRLFVFPYLAGETAWVAQAQAAGQSLKLVFLGLSGLAVLGLLLWRATWTKERLGLWLLSLSVLVTGLCIFGQRTPVPLGFADYLDPILGGRYLLVGTQLSLLVLLLPVEPPRAGQATAILSSLLVVLFLAGAFDSYRHHNPSGPDWRQEVERFRADPSYRPEVWPGGEVWRFSIAPGAD